MSAKSPRHTDRPSLTKIVKRHGNSATKRQAVESLANRFPDERTRALLTELAREESFHRREWLVDARRQAVKSLMEHFPDAQTRALFIELAHLRDDSTAQCVAIELLGERFRDHEIRALLMELAGRGDDSRVRAQAIHSLGQHFNGPETTTLFLKILRSADHSFARVCAAAWLSKHSPNSEVRTILTEVALGDGEDDTRKGSIVLLLLYFREVPETRLALVTIARTELGRKVMRAAAEHGEPEEIKYAISILGEATLTTVQHVRSEVSGE